MHEHLLTFSAPTVNYHLMEECNEVMSRITKLVSLFQVDGHTIESIAKD